MRKFLATLLLIISSTTYSQTLIDRNQLQAVDTHVQRLGTMPDASLQYITDTLTSPYKDQLLKARAIYGWIARNIRFEGPAYRHERKRNDAPYMTLRYRAAVSEGYAILFETMCRHARIQCVTINGLGKMHVRDIGKVSATENRCAWNAIKVNGAWYTVDVTRGAGTRDRKARFFEKNFTDVWFMADRYLFALSHFPDKKEWQLLEQPITRPQFTMAPLIGIGALKVGLRPVRDMRGNIRGRQDSVKHLSFTVSAPQMIKRFTAAMEGETPYEVPHELQGNDVTLHLPLKQYGTEPITIYVNGEPAFTYTTNISKAVRKTQSKK